MKTFLVILTIRDFLDKVKFFGLRKIYYLAKNSLKNNRFLGRLFRKNLNTPKYWDKRLLQHSKFWRDEHDRDILKYLPKNIHFSLLDIGCAVGDGCILLKQKLPKAKIFDIDFSGGGN